MHSSVKSEPYPSTEPYLINVIRRKGMRCSGKVSGAVLMVPKQKESFEESILGGEKTSTWDIPLGKKYG